MFLNFVLYELLAQWQSSCCLSSSACVIIVTYWGSGFSEFGIIWIIWLVLTSSVIQTKLTKLAHPEVNEHFTIHKDAIETNDDHNDADEIPKL